MMATLSEAIEQFTRRTKLIPVVGIEQEFYLLCSETLLRDTPHEQGVPQQIVQGLAACGLPPQCVTQEKGHQQYEMILPESENIEQIVALLRGLRASLHYACKSLEVSFAAKPVSDQPGSAMHVHLSLYDDAKRNVLAKPDSSGEEESPLMLHAIGGLLAMMPEHMPIFAPNNEDKERFIVRGYAEHTPSNVSWGGNNRTTALRIPASTAFPHKRHIEHRVPCANADPEAVIIAILAGVEKGITEQLLPMSDKIYGDASLAQYDLPTLYPPTAM